MQLSPLDNIEPPLYTQVFWGFAGPFTPALADTLRSTLNTAIQTHLPALYNHALVHDPATGYSLVPIDSTENGDGTEGDGVEGIPFRVVDGGPESTVPPPPTEADPAAPWTPPPALFAPFPALDGAHEFPLAVTVASLADGAGAAVGVSLHHCVGDAGSLVLLMAAWSEQLGGPPLPHPLVHDPELLRAPSAAPADPHAVPDACTMAIPIPRMPGLDPDAAKAMYPPTVVWRKRYSRDTINALKDAAAASPGNDAVSSNDVICADVWQTAAVELADQDAPLAFVFPANMRGRATALPAGYFGNAIINCVANPSPARDVAAAAIGELSARIGDAKRAGATQAGLDAVIAWETGRAEHPRAFCTTARQPAVLLTSWAHFDLFGAGSLGGILGDLRAAAPHTPFGIPRVGYVLPTAPQLGDALDVLFFLDHPAPTPAPTEASA